MTNTGTDGADDSLQMEGDGGVTEREQPIGFDFPTEPEPAANRNVALATTNDTELARRLETALALLFEKTEPTIQDLILAVVKRHLGDAPIPAFQTKSNAVYRRDDDPETGEPTGLETFIDEQFFDLSFLEDYELVEHYWVNKPYAFVAILYDPDEKEHYYHVVEPELDDFERYVQSDLISIMRNSLMYEDIGDIDDREAVFTEKAVEKMAVHADTVHEGSLYKLLYYLKRDFIHFGEIDPLMADPAIEDISCDGSDIPLFIYHRDYRDLETNVRFSQQRLNSFTVRLAQRAGKHISVSDPLMDASLPDGSRIQLTLGSDISTRGSNFTIRKFADIPFSPVDLINMETFSVPQMAYFWLAIENNKSLIFAGGTGSGKTTSMNAVSFFIPPNSKVVSIEDTREITLPHNNWIQSVTRDSLTAEGRGEVSMYKLLQAALRQRPEYLLVGEIRTETNVALTFFQAMTTGHTAYTTVHADSVDTVLGRLHSEPLNVPNQMIRELDIVSIQTQTFKDDRRVRRNNIIAEIVGTADGDGFEVRNVFERDSTTDEHTQVGSSHVLETIAAERGWDADRLDDELELRGQVLQYLIDAELDSYADVSAVLHTYSKNPEFVLEQIRNETLDPEELQVTIR